jgi:hypothetical protein
MESGAAGLRAKPGEQRSRVAQDNQREQAISQALKAADEIAAALQAHLIEEHGADLDPGVRPNPSADSLKLLRHARERLGQGLRSIETGDVIAREP